MAGLRGADLSEADLRGASLQQATLVETNLKGAVLDGCRIYGISAWDLELDEDTKKDIARAIKEIESGKCKTHEQVRKQMGF